VIEVELAIITAELIIPALVVLAIQALSVEIGERSLASPSYFSSPVHASSGSGYLSRVPPAWSERDPGI